MFCMHGNEACRECNSDMREDNSFVSGVDHVAGREGIVVQFALDKVKRTCYYPSITFALLWGFRGKETD
jgi:hypothetical protein